MKPIYFFSILTLLTLVGCSTIESACEDITLASEQIKECQSLQRQITHSKNEPIKRTELERRYQVDCIDIRFYRDDKQKAKCGNKHKLAEIIKTAKEESQQ